MRGASTSARRNIPPAEQGGERPPNGQGPGFQTLAGVRPGPGDIGGALAIRANPAIIVLENLLVLMVVQTHSFSRAEDPSILLISDDFAARREIYGHLHAEFRNPVVSCINSVKELGQLPVDHGCSLCIVCDDGRKGYLEALERIREQQLECPILLMLELENEKLAAEATRRGVNEYIIKTSGYGERLRAAVSAMVCAAGEYSSAGYRENFRALEVNAKQFRELVENAVEGILIHVDEQPAYVNTALVRLLGYDRREDLLNLESIYDFVDPRDRGRVLKITRRLSAGVAPSDTYVFRARRPDGELLWLENRVKTVTWQGFPAVQCTLVDVSERHRASNALRLAAKVASRVGDQVDFEDAIRVALRWLARGMGWELAESWVPSADRNVLEPGPVWCSDQTRYRRFILSSRDWSFAKGEGLVGQVWETGRPEWVDDVADAHMLFRRSILANEAGLRSGCAIPIIAHGRTIAVLCFFMSAARVSSRELIAALGAGAASLGPVLLQIRTDQARRASLAQTDTLISNNLDGILVVDDQGRILFANPAAQKAFGRDLDALRGMAFGTPSLDQSVAEIEIRNARTGAIRVNEMRVAEIDWDGQAARLVSLRDVTERNETQRALEEHQAALQERVKELGCLYTVSEYLSSPALEWTRILQHVVDAMPNGWRCPEATHARLRVDDLEVVSDSFRETSWRIWSDITSEGKTVGRVEVFCDESRERDAGPFLKEEQSLLDELARRISQAVSTRRFQQQLDASRRRFQDFAEAASDWLWEMDENLRFTYFSDRIQTVMGQSVEHWIGKTRRELAVEHKAGDDSKWDAHFADLEARRPFRNFRYHISLSDGRTRHIAISGTPMFDDDGVFRGYRGSGTDETGQVAAEHRAQESDRRLQGVANRLPGIVFQRLRKPDGRMEYPYLSAGITTLFGFQVSEVQEDPLLWADRIHPEDRPRFHVALNDSSHTLEPMDMKFRMTTRSGEERWFWHRSTPRRLANGDTAWDCIELDITEQKEAEARVQYLGYHDQLTGLPNRELFVERIGQVLPIAARNRQPVAVGMLGLKRFKQVNEEFGMSGGDEVLRTAAKRFNDCLRPGDSVARLGGDRFLFLLPSVGTDTATHKPFERLMKAMEQPFTINHKQILLSFNMGIAVFPDDGDSAEALIQKADTAQAHFSRWGPGYGYTFYKDRMPASETSRLALEKDLRDAIESEDQLKAFFQPLYDSATGRLTAVETLARWMHPERGLVPPGEFIHLAEDTGMINPLGLKILRQACIHARSWEQAGLPRVVVTVNVSAKQIRDPGLAQSIKKIIRETGMAPHRLLLEVTESTLIADLDRGSQFIEELVAEGVYFALDDFGVGYSSLSYLSRLPVHALKIDRSFMRDLRSDPRSESTIRAIVALAHALELHVVAEGIEEREQMEHVKRLGCDTLQGFWLGRPMPAAELEALLASRESIAAVREAPASPDPG